MNIKWHGLSAFSLKHKDIKILTDPHLANIDAAKVGANIVLTSDDTEIKGKDFQQFNWPGEYESQNVSIQIIPFEGKNILLFEIDGVKFCHLGSLNENPTSEILEKIGGVDVLLVPIGNKEKMMDHKGAIDVIEQIEPKCVIPMNYKSEKYGEDLGTNEAFLRELGLKEVEEHENYSFKDFAVDKTEYVVLKARD
ncbi:MBL fold metallo-hydrolase [Patescibacteria group bacterium]|nr:MBL fold metallo-hydrolase [Patescibacteria group bacterium]